MYVGVSNKQMESAVVHSSSALKLPVKGDWIVAIATAVMSPTRFYAQLPVGCKSPLSLQELEYVEGILLMWLLLCYSSN